MAKHLGSLSIPVVPSDPSSPDNGDIWYNSGTGKFRKREGGVISDWVVSTTPTLNSVLTAGNTSTLTIALTPANNTNGLTIIGSFGDLYLRNQGGTPEIHLTDGGAYANGDTKITPYDIRTKEIAIAASSGAAGRVRISTGNTTINSLLYIESGLNGFVNTMGDDAVGDGLVCHIGNGVLVEVTLTNTGTGSPSLVSGVLNIPTPTLQQVITAGSTATITGLTTLVNSVGSYGLTIDQPNTVTTLMGGTKSGMMLLGAGIDTVLIGDVNGAGNSTLIAIDDSGKGILFNGGGTFNFSNNSVTTGGRIQIDSLKSGSTAPINTGTAHMVTCDANGQLSHQAIPSGGGSIASTSVVLKGNGSGGAVAATAGTDFSAGTSALATGILKSTTTTGTLTIAVAADFPTLNQNTTGSAATLTTPRTINGTAFDGSTNITITAAGSTLTGTSLNSTIVTSSLTSLGTITTGVWNGTAIGAAYGGAPTGGSTGNILAKNSGTNYDYAWVTATAAGVASEQLTFNTQTGSYTLVLTDKATKAVEMNVASANNLTIPPNSSVAFPIGTQIVVTQYGAGQTSIVAGAGVTIRSAGGKLKLTGQYSAATLIKRGTDEWYLIGDITT